ncbi:MAG TPA: carboxypeptidase-like regulatory domain-containing protein [Candidatus Binatia bacterium]|nr:carboxypeptidase-like regulatory domain-containing protein [Candidatus Binatia bacterium]
MTRILGWWCVVIALCGSAVAGVDPGSISGSVTDSSGIAQMGATVEMLAVGTGQRIVSYTDAVGHFTVYGLIPGNYDIRVTAPSFLPTVREDVSLASGAAKVVNITLNTLFEAARVMPARKRGNDDDDSWKWTLRSTANRPILRFDDGVPVVVEASQSDHGLKGSLAFMAGGTNEGYGSSSDVGTTFAIEQSVGTFGVVGFDGSLGYGTGTPDGYLRATFLGGGATGAPHELGFTVRRFSGPDLLIHHGSLQSFALTTANTMSVGDFLELQYGGELETIQFMGRANAFRPYGIADWHIGDSTIIEYRYSTTEPTTRTATKSFDGWANVSAAELNDPGPRMTLLNATPLLENAHHHEISLSQRFGDNRVQIAYFRDRIKNPALLGVGEINLDTGDFLPDVYSGTFSYNGIALDTQGVRFVAQRKLTNEITGTIDYAYGGVLSLEHPGIGWDALRSDMHQTWRHSAAVKLAGTVPRWNTEWIISYRWTNAPALTPVDMFNASAGQTDPYFNFFVRQPFPRLHFMPGRMEAIVDLRNLLAQGYVPVISPDGNTVYLVQSARSVRGGVAFTF